jgi:hypothetical protein
VSSGGKAAGAAIEALKGQPLALALVIVNVCFLIAAAWFLTYIGGSAREATQRRDALISQLAKDCIVIAPAPKAAP